MSNQRTPLDPAPSQVELETAKLALQAVKDAYQEDADRHQSIMTRTTSLISLAGVLLSIYVAFVLRLIIERGVHKLDLILAILTFISLALGFAIGLAVFIPRRFERIDTAFLLEDEFQTNPPTEAAIALTDVYNRLLGVDEAVLTKMFSLFLIGTGSLLVGLLLVAVQAVLLLVRGLCGG